MPTLEELKKKAREAWCAWASGYAETPEKRQTLYAAWEEANHAFNQMFMAQKAMTHEGRVLWLAEWQVECPELRKGKGCHCNLTSCDNRCRICRGTGIVTRFPILRRKCSCDAGKVAGHSDMKYWAGETGHYVRDCTLCRGRGWIPANDMETMLLACLSIGIHNINFDYEDDRVHVRLTPEGKDSDEIQGDFEWLGVASAPANAPNEALTEALYRVAIKPLENKVSKEVR